MGQGRLGLKKKNYIPAFVFHSLTPFYDMGMRLIFPVRKYRERIISLTQISEAERVLDFGTGTGQVASTGLKMNPNTSFTGLDIDPKILRLAIAQHPKILFHEYDGDRFPYEDESFHHVVSGLTFHHLHPDDKRNAMKEFYRILKPGGKVVIGDFGNPKNFFFRILFLWVQFFDGFINTKFHANGSIPFLFGESGFVENESCGDIPSAFGTLQFWRSQKPFSNGNALK